MARSSPEGNFATGLAFTNTANIVVTNAATSPTLTLTGNTGSVYNSFAGGIVDGNVSTNVAVIGNTTWVLSGVSNYTGPTNIASGTLGVTGTLANSAVTLASPTSTLFGNGTIAGSVTVSSGNVIAGFSTNGSVAFGGGAPGIQSNLTVGSLNYSGNSMLNFTLNGTYNATTQVTTKTSGSNTSFGTTDLYSGIIVTATNGLTLSDLSGPEAFNFFGTNTTTGNLDTTVPWRLTGFYNLLEYNGTLGGDIGGNLALLSGANVTNAINGDVYTFGSTSLNGTTNMLFVDIVSNPGNYAWISPVSGGNWSTSTDWTHGGPRQFRQHRRSRQLPRLKRWSVEHQFGYQCEHHRLEFLQHG